MYDCNFGTRQQGFSFCRFSAPLFKIDMNPLFALNHAYWELSIRWLEFIPSDIDILCIYSSTFDSLNSVVICTGRTHQLVASATSEHFQYMYQYWLMMQSMTEFGGKYFDVFLWWWIVLKLPSARYYGTDWKWVKAWHILYMFRMISTRSFHIARVW